MADEQEKPRKPRRRWFQFSLRTLMLFVTLLSVWLGYTFNRASRQRVAVEKLSAAGAMISYDFEHDSFLDRSAAAKKKPPAWLREIVGIDYLSNVASVRFDSRANLATGDDMKHLRWLTGLKDIEVPRQATDAGLRHLSGLRSLRRVDIGGYHFTNAGMAHLESLRNLRGLLVMGTEVTDDGLYHCRNLTDLKYLILTGSRITGAGFEHLKRLGNLTHLRLNHTLIDDEGLEQIGGLTSLTLLDLVRTNVTDDGLRHLRALKQLKELTLPAGVTHEGLDSLRSALPGASIYVQNDDGYAGRSERSGHAF